MQKDASNQQYPQHDWADYTDMPVGDILRKTRAYYNLSIEDVEGALRIRASQLTALEEGQIEKLPGRVYAIGFVRAYAEFLGLDGDKMVYLFKSQLGGNKPRPELNFPVAASESKLPNLYILLASFAGLVLVVGIYLAMGQTKQPRQEIPEVPVAMKQEAAIPYGPPEPPADMAMSDPEADVTAPRNRVVINVTGNSWVEIRNSKGKAILSRILKKGDSYLVPDEEGLIMDTGNIGALEFTVDGKVLEPLGEPGDVRRGISLAPSSLAPPPTSPGNTPQTSNSAS